MRKIPRPFACLLLLQFFFCNTPSYCVPKDDREEQNPGKDGFHIRKKIPRERPVIYDYISEIRKGNLPKKSTAVPQNVLLINWEIYDFFPLFHPTGNTRSRNHWSKTFYTRHEVFDLYTQLPDNKKGNLCDTPRMFFERILQSDPQCTLENLSILANFLKNGGIFKSFQKKLAPQERIDLNVKEFHLFLETNQAIKRPLSKHCIRFLAGGSKTTHPVFDPETFKSNEVTLEKMSKVRGYGWYLKHLYSEHDMEEQNLGKDGFHIRKKIPRERPVIYDYVSEVRKGNLPQESTAVPQNVLLINWEIYDFFPLFHPTGNTPSKTHWSSTLKTPSRVFDLYTQLPDNKKGNLFDTPRMFFERILQSDPQCTLENLSILANFLKNGGIFESFQKKLAPQERIDLNVKEFHLFLKTNQAIKRPLLEYCIRFLAGGSKTTHPVFDPETFKFNAYILKKMEKHLGRNYCYLYIDSFDFGHLVEYFKHAEFFTQGMTRDQQRMLLRTASTTFARTRLDIAYLTSLLSSFRRKLKAMDNDPTSIWLVLKHLASYTNPTLVKVFDNSDIIWEESSAQWLIQNIVESTKETVEHKTEK